MMKITELTKLTLKSLSDKNLEITPSNYENEFYNIAIQNNFKNDDIIDIESLLSKLSNSDKTNLNTITYKNLAKTLSNRVKNEDLKYFLKHLVYLMGPSLSTNIRTDINNICSDISNKPTSLVDTDTIRRLRAVTKQRIEQDKNIFNEKNNDVKKLINFLSEYLRKRIDNNKITIDEILNIKNDIHSLELSETSDKQINKLYKRLSKLTEKFEKFIENDTKTIEDANDKLYSQIEKLKMNLIKAEDEKSIDFLTKVLNRRAYSKELERIEDEYQTYNCNYAIVFLDIDHFKDVNDTYGHLCGDSVLSTFASILKKLTRDEDLITRYGGEEFICLIHYENISDVQKYVSRVKNIVENNKFVFDENKLNIKFSAGVTFRENYDCYNDMIKKADSLLYKAKTSGRGKIIFDYEK